MSIAAIIQSVISAVIAAVIIWYIQRSFRKHDERDEARDKAKGEFNVLLIRGVDAAITLGEKTAVCVKNERVNGDMDEAHRYATEVKHDIDNFVRKQAGGMVR